MKQGRGVMSRNDYEQLFRYLASPRPRFVLVDHLPGVLQPCDAPDDPEWPAPKEAPSSEHSPIIDLLRRLPHRQRVVTMATAARMMVPLWMAVVDHTNPSYGLLPWAVDVIENWIAGDASGQDLSEAQRRTWEIADYRHGGAVGHATAAAVSNAAWAVDDESRTLTSGKWALYWASDAVQYWSNQRHATASPRRGLPGPSADSAADATRFDWTSSAPGDAVPQFLADWWMRCRCRLAFVDASRVTLE